jgi:hypothetical protein
LTVANGVMSSTIFLHVGLPMLSLKLLVEV